METTATKPTLTVAQLDELIRLKAYFPFRVVWAAVCPKTQAFVCFATTTKRSANAYARKGWTVFILGNEDKKK